MAEGESECCSKEVNCLITTFVAVVMMMIFASLIFCLHDFYEYAHFIGLPPIVRPTVRSSAIYTDRSIPVILGFLTQFIKLIID